MRSYCLVLVLRRSLEDSIEQLRLMLPLCFGVVLLSSVAHFISADLAIPLLGEERFDRGVYVILLFLGEMVLVMPAVSLVRARHFVRSEDGSLDLVALWRSLSINPMFAMFGLGVAIYGMTAMGSLVEVYRAGSKVWHDSVLWGVERPVFEVLLASPFNAPMFWDGVYMSFWIGVLAMASMLHGVRRFDLFYEFLLAAVVAFFLTRILAIAWPTAGPVFHAAGFFHLDGTSSEVLQGYLLEYMEGSVHQTGWIPGTMAMPSLHVGVTAMAAWYLGREFRWSYWISLPWFALIWLSTIFLGWHYILDGVGGLVVTAVSIFMASRFNRLVNHWMVEAIRRGRLCLVSWKLMPLFMRVLLSGGIATLAQFGTMIVLVELTATPALGASLAGYLIGMLVGYLLNYHFAFRSHRLHQDTLWRFVVVAGLGFAFNGLLMAWFLEFVGMGYLLAQLITTAVVFLWNFAANGLWTFKWAK